LIESGATVESSSGRNIVEVLAEEFVCRHRQGEQPSVSEYTKRHPKHAEEIEDLFPALLMMENLKPAEDDENPANHNLDPALHQLGDYRIIRELGRGGMGIVYEAEQISLGRHVALKVLPQSLLANPAHRQRFEREARAAASLHHTNIVPVFGVGEEDGRYYYVMQFIRGRTLDNVLDELRQMLADTEAQQSQGCQESADREDFAVETLIPGSLEAAQTSAARDSKASQQTEEIRSDSESTVALPGSEANASAAGKLTYCHSVSRVGIQVAGALSYAHAQGVLHRDIKPSNLLLDLRGTVWVTDFGLARMEDEQDLTKTGDVLGTLRYMAPETFKGKADARSEIYSLGLTLYELLAFRPAFEQTNRNHLIQDVMNSRVEPLAKFSSDIPADLRTVIHKAIEHEPDHRYQTAQELADDLQRIVNDEPIKARRIFPHERFLRWARRNKALAAALSSVAVLLTALTIGSMFAVDRLNENVENLTAAQAEAASKTEEINRQREQAEQHLYAAQIAVTVSRLTANDANDAQRSLTAAIPEHEMTDRRGWEWYYLDQWANGGHRTFRETPAHGYAYVSAVAFSPDGQLLATATGGDPFAESEGNAPVPGEVVVRDFLTGQIRHKLKAHTDVVRSVSFSPGGRELITGGRDHRIVFWNVDSGQRIGDIDCSGTHPDLFIHRVEYSPDGNHILVELKKPRSAGHQDGVAVVYSVADKRIIHEVKAVKAEFLGRSQLCFLPVDQRSTILCLQLASGEFSEPLHQPIPGGHLWGLAVSPGGQYFAAVNRQQVLVWQTQTGELTQTLQVEQEVTRLEFSSDEAHLSSSGRTGVVCIWEVATERKVATHLDQYTVKATAFSPDGRWIAVSNDQGETHVHSTQREMRSVSLPTGQPQLSSLLFSRDGTRIKCVSSLGSPNLQEWDVGSGKPLARHSIASNTDVFWRRRDFAFSFDGHRLAAPRVQSGEIVTIWDTDTATELLSLDPHPAQVSAIAFSGNDRFLATASPQQASSVLQIQDATTGQRLQSISTRLNKIQSIVFCPDGSLVAAGGSQGSGGSVVVWNLASGERKYHFDTERAIDGLAFSPNGEQLAAGEYSGSRVLVWDLNQGNTVGSLDGLSGVGEVAWSPDGKRLAAICQDASVHLCDSETLTDLITLRTLGPPSGTLGFTPCVTFSPDGSRIAANSPHGVVTVWDAGRGFVNKELERSVRIAQAWLGKKEYELATKAAQNALNCETPNRDALKLSAAAWSVIAACRKSQGDRVGAADAEDAGRAVLTEMEQSHGEGLGAMPEFIPAPHAPVTSSQTAPLPPVSDDARQMTKADMSVEADLAAAGMTPAEVLTSERWEWDEPVKLDASVTSSGIEYAPTLSADGLIMMFGSNRHGSEDFDIWTTDRASLQSPWSRPKNVGMPINTADYEGQPALSADGLTLMFMTRYPMGQERTLVSTRTSRDAPWSNPVPVWDARPRGFGDPCFSADSLQLFYRASQSMHPSSGLYVSTRSSVDGPWSDPVSLGPAINQTETAARGPRVSPDGLTLFYSAASPGMPWKLMMSSRSTVEASWSSPLHLSELGDVRCPWISPNGRTLIYEKRADLWTVHRVPKRDLKP